MNATFYVLFALVALASLGRGVLALQRILQRRRGMATIAWTIYGVRRSRFETDHSLRARCKAAANQRSTQAKV